MSLRRPSAPTAFYRLVVAPATLQIVRGLGVQQLFPTLLCRRGSPEPPTATGATAASRTAAAPAKNAQQFLGNLRDFADENSLTARRAKADMVAVAYNCPETLKNRLFWNSSKMIGVMLEETSRDHTKKLPSRNLPKTASDRISGWGKSKIPRGITLPGSGS